MHDKCARLPADIDLRGALLVLKAAKQKMSPLSTNMKDLSRVNALCTIFFYSRRCPGPCQSSV